MSERPRRICANLSPIAVCHPVLYPLVSFHFCQYHLLSLRDCILGTFENKFSLECSTSAAFPTKTPGNFCWGGISHYRTIKNFAGKIFSRGSEAQYILEVCRPQGKFVDHAPYCVNNAAARGKAAATYRKTVHELSSTSVEFLKMYGCVPLRQRGQNHVVTQQKFNVFHKLPAPEIYTTM